jgi:hypothetical protein
MGPVAEVTALTDTRVNQIETEDCAALAFRMQNGALATSSVTLGAGNDTTRLTLLFRGRHCRKRFSPLQPGAGRMAVHCARARHTGRG